MSLGWGRTGDICYHYKKIEIGDALYRFLYTVYCQPVTDLRRLTDTFDKRITLVSVPSSKHESSVEIIYKGMN